MNLSELPQRLVLHIGAVQSFALPSASGGGYRWTAQCDNGADIADVRVQIEALTPAAPLAPASGGAAEPPALSLAAETVVVRALATGSAHWRLVLTRTFGPPGSWAEHLLQVNVTGVDSSERLP